jgi:hypothetical protein
MSTYMPLVGRLSLLNKKVLYCETVYASWSWFYFETSECNMQGKPWWQSYKTFFSVTDDTCPTELEFVPKEQLGLVFGSSAEVECLSVEASDNTLK